MKKRRLALAGPVLLLMLALSGCFFRGVDQLYTVPQPSKDYEALQVCLSQVVNQGGEYAAPLTGEMIQSVQLQDLDGDGSQEAIAFFRLANEQKPMKIYIFRRNGDAYETMAVIEGAATAINSVDYVQMNDDPVKEIVVSWQMTAQVRSLAVYSVGPQQVEELLRTDYDGYQLFDLDQDGQQELVAFRTPTGGTPQAELYDFVGGDLALAGTAPLSVGAVTGADGSVKTDYLSSLRTGYLAGGVPALFAVSSYGESGTITDIFLCGENGLENISLDEETGESSSTVRYYTQVAETDINGDGVTEIPQPVPLADYTVTGSGVNFWLIHWWKYDAQGNSTLVYTTYHNDRDGWYFILPDWWGENLVLTRYDVAGGGERAVTFSYWAGDESVEPIPFLTIYKLTGTNRATRARMGERFTLLGGSGAEIIYAAEFKEGWDCGLTQDDVRERFATIKTDWYNG